MPTETYAIARSLVPHIAYHAASSPGFWDALGDLLKPDGFEDPALSLCIGVARAYWKKNGAGPPHSLVVIQDAVVLSSSGRITSADVEAIDDLITQGEQAPLDLELLIETLLPAVQAVARADALRCGLDEHAKGGDLSRLADTVRKVNEASATLAVGGVKVFDPSVALNPSNEGAILTGMDDLDTRIVIRPGEFVVWMSDPGGGKSIALSQMTAAAAVQGKRVAVATLEIPENVWAARVFAALSDVPTNAIRDGSQLDLVRSRLAAAPPFAHPVIKYFPLRATTTATILSWLDKQRDQIDVLIVDYADLVGSRRKKDASTHEAATDVYETFLGAAVERNILIATASQSRGRGDNAKRKALGGALDMSDVADSIGKPRTADKLITITPREVEGRREVTLFVAKDRLDEGRFIVGTFPTDFTFGRLVPSRLLTERHADLAAYTPPGYGSI